MTTSGPMSMSGQGALHIGSSSMRVGDINIEDLAQQAEKIGFDPEIRALIDGIEKIHNDLKKKNLELCFLEIVAMESTDENIADLRQQLFTAVRLIHGDEIEGLLNDEREVRRLSNMVGGGFLPDSKPRPMSEKEQLHKGIMTRFQKYFHDYRQLRVEIKDLKKRWKHRNDGDMYDDSACESSG